MKIKNFLFVTIISILSAVATFYFLQEKQNNYVKTPQEALLNTYKVRPVTNFNNSITSFTDAAAVSTPAVVHVNASYEINTNQSRQFYGNEAFEWFFGNRNNYNYQQQKKRAISSGSGVIISNDGYIVTNNHVIEKANSIEVTLSNNKKYKAVLIGRDKDTDLAVLKIEEKKLPSLSFANSDDVLVGEWVLAVGNPFDLSSTVTAGIVSAKGRNINILQNYSRNSRSNTAIESFIQTDAAVNPGNSGGALVNTKGELIGINTAIATPTGTFAGYSFAVPSNLVSKIVDDIIHYGKAQRVFLGVNITNITNEMAYKLQLKDMQGVYITNVLSDGNAEKIGILEGDVLIAIDNNKINSISELQEKMAEYKLGSSILISLIRNGREIKIKANFN